MPAKHSKSASSARHHVTSACGQCRRSKIKCDGQHPTCGQCSLKNRSCVFDDGPDRRRISAQKSIRAFSKRVRQLQDFITTNGLVVPPPEDQHSSWTLDRLMDAYAPSPLPSDGQSSRFAVARPSDVAAALTSHVAEFSQEELSALEQEGGFGTDQLQPSTVSTIQDDDPSDAATWANAPMADFSNMTDADWVWNMPITGEGYNQSYLDMSRSAPLMDFFASASGPPLFDVQIEPMDLLPNDYNVADNSEASEYEDHAEVTNQISDRMGGLLVSKDGQWRFYGATSNLHLARSRSDFGSATKGISQQMSQNEERLKLFGVAQTVDPILVQQLLDLYFSWHNASLHIVDHDVFQHGRDLYTRECKSSTFYSEFLVNAMCAIGASLDTRNHPNLPVPLSEFFAKRAKVLLELELNEPQVATVQGLAILSSHEAGFMRDTRAWLFSGMAVRLAYDLGLHTSTKRYVEEGSMTPEEANARNIAIWGCFMNDRGCGLYLGRPFHTNVKDIASESPVLHDRHSDFSCWNVDTPGDGTPNSSQQCWNPQGVLLDRFISLHKTMSSLGHRLYASKDTTNRELQSLAQETFEQLVQWRSTLPAEVDIDVATIDDKIILPHVLGLHLYYALLIITLHRPFCSKHYIQPQPLVGRGPQHARDMCIKSAVDIARLLACYKRLYTFRRANIQIVHTAFTAALILVYATVSGITGQSRVDLKGQLDTCCDALADLGATFVNANRALDVLLAAKRTWQARMLTSL